MVHDIIKEELKDVHKMHKSERQTKIVAAEEEMEMEDLIANEPMIITLSQDDYIKRMPIDTFREQRRGGTGVAGIAKKREEDVLKGIYVADTHDYLLLFTNLGRCYWLKVWRIPEIGRKSKGKPLINFLEGIRPEEKVATILSASTFEGEKYILLATRKGVVKKTELKAFSNPRRTGIWAINIEDGDEVVAAREVELNQQIMLFTRNGMAIRFDEDKVRPMGRMAHGVKGVKMRDENDAVVGCEVVSGNESILIVCEKGFGKRSHVEDFRKTNRGGLGVRSIITSERNGKVMGAQCITDVDSVVMMSAGGKAIRINMRDLRVMGRSTQGVTVTNLRDDDILVALHKIESEG